MAERRRKFDAEFREGAVRIVTETRKPVAQVAKDLGINETTLASWVPRARSAGVAWLGDHPGDRRRCRAPSADMLTAGRCAPAMPA
ncbi:transposase [Streptomyces cyslabdanicus]|uniref:transposase n=1 Tax=Streptomyces cyslabdanicus TaxID=1470456 RepID=UPI004043D73D